MEGREEQRSSRPRPGSISGCFSGLGHQPLPESLCGRDREKVFKSSLYTSGRPLTFSLKLSKVPDTNDVKQYFI